LGKLRDTSIELKKTRAILAATQKTESFLTSEAQELLETLKKSIIDGDSLHTLLEKNREEDIVRRSNTRKFSDAQNTVLDDVLQYLSLLSQSATSLCNQLKEEADKNHTSSNNSIDQTTSLFKQLSADISDISSTIRNQIVGEDGIVPVISSTTSDSIAGLDHTSNIISESEENLFTAISYLRKRLQEHSKEIGRLWTVLDTNSETAISSLETNVDCSKEKVTKVVESANQTLTAIKNFQKEARDSQSELITSWENSSVESTQNIQSKAESRHKAVNESLEVFKAEMRNIDEIDTVLTTQHSFISKSQGEVKSQLDSQKAALVDLKNTQNNDCEKLKLLRESFVSNVMKGVQSLIDEQMDRMKTENIRHFDNCEARSRDLLEQNAKMADSTESIFGNLKNDNVVLANNSKSVRKSNLDAADTMESAQKTLFDLSSASSKHEIDTKSYARKVEENISVMSKLDTDADELIERLHGNKEDFIAEQLENSILKKGKDNMTLLAESGRALTSYSNTVLIPECCTSLDSMQAPRPGIMQNFNTAINDNKERLQRGKSDVESISEKQCSKTDEIQAYVRSKQDLYNNNICMVQKAQLDNQKENVTLKTKEYRESTTTNVSACSSSTSAVQANMEEFIVGTIKAREDVEPLCDRVNFTFNENFSSTPEDRIICEPLNYDNEMAIGVES